MQQNETEGRDDLVSISEAARQLRLNKSTLSRQIKAKRIRSHNGQVRISEVRADRSASIAIRIPRADRNIVAPIMLHDGATNAAEPKIQHTITGHRLPLSVETLVSIGWALGSEHPEDPIEVAEDAVYTGMDILRAEIRRLEAVIIRAETAGDKGDAEG